MLEMETRKCSGEAQGKTLYLYWGYIKMKSGEHLEPGFMNRSSADQIELCA